MTNEEISSKLWLEHTLQETGYLSYAKLLHVVDLKLTSDPDTVGYFNSAKKLICVNKDLDESTVCTVIRHEIMHKYLHHYERGKEFILNKFGDEDKYGQFATLLNIAADYEISNLSYSLTDKNNIRHLKINGVEKGGLITEDDHPDWITLSFEEIAEKLMEKNPDGMSGNGEGEGSYTDGKSEGKPWNSAATDDVANESVSVASDGCEHDRVEADDTQLISIDELLDILGQDLGYESRSRVSKETVEKATKEQKENYLKYLKGIGGFEDALNDFVKNELGSKRIYGWERMNNRTEPYGFYQRGRYTKHQNTIPLINVYFDRSGSWDAEKTAVGKEALAILQSYEQKRKLKLNIKYFAERVTLVDDGSAGCGTWGTPILDDIEDTNPDNVIIMTDSDISDCDHSIEIPGHVWFLFKGGVSENIIGSVKGICGERVFELK